MDIDFSCWVNDIVRHSDNEKLWDIDIHGKSRQAFTRKPTTPPRPDNRADKSKV